MAPISGNCVICGIYRVSLHRDHIVPKSLGGSDEPDNIQLLCANCHQDKTTIDIGIIQDTPSFSAARSAAKREQWARPEYKAKMRSTLNSTEHRAKKSRLSKENWTNPEYRANVMAARNTPEYLARHTATMKTRWQDPGFRAKQAAAWPGRRAASLKNKAWVEAYIKGERDYIAWEKSYDEKINAV